MHGNHYALYEDKLATDDFDSLIPPLPSKTINFIFQILLNLNVDGRNWKVSNVLLVSRESTAKLDLGT